MKRFALAALSALMASTAAMPAVQAQITAAAPPSNAAAIGMGVTPFNLVFLAYQGFFESEGVPKFSQLVNAHRSGRVKADDLIKIAVKMKRLPNSALTNQSYQMAVEAQLMSLGVGN